MSTMPQTLVLVSTMPCEVGVGALYHCLDEEAHIFIMKIAEARSFETCIKTLPQREGKYPEQIIMIGTYWMECLEKLVSHYDKTIFEIYCPGKVPDLEFKGKERIILTCGEGGVGPSRFTFNLAKRKCKSASLVKLFEKNFSLVMTFIDDRFVNKNILENQSFYTGLCNFGPIEDSLYEKFVKLFEGEFNLEEVIKTGRVIVSSQMLIARERALNNSRMEKLLDGTLAAVSEGPELVNLTHDALREKYPESQVTLVVGIKFGKDKKGDELSYSIRSFDANVNAKKLAQKVRGDGSSNTAGGRIHIELPNPF
jgi:hypothetical protein